MDTFERFIQWIYSGLYNISEFETQAGADERYLQLAQLYTLADKLRVRRLKNDIIDKVFEIKAKANRPPQIPTLSYVYGNSMEKSSFRKLMVAWYAWHIDFEWYSKEGTKDVLAENPEFTADLAMILAKRLVNPHQLSPLVGEAHNYYEEAEDQENISQANVQ